MNSYDAVFFRSFFLHSSGYRYESAYLSVERPVHALIADDLQDNLNIVQAILTYKGYSVATAKNGKQILERAAERATDLFLLDIQMP